MRHEKFPPSFDCQASFARFGARARLARKAHGLTLVELEAKCGIHRTTLARFEHGDLGVSAQVILAVLEALQELPDIELLLTKPEELRHNRSPAKSILDRNF